MRQKSAGGRRGPGHGAKADTVRDRAIVALLSAKTLTDAAERAGVAERTIRRWLADDDAFKAALADARRAAFQAGMSRVQALTADAVSTLEALLATDVSDAVRLGAARTIAEIGIHQQDAEQILRRLDEIESLQREQEDR